MGPIHTKMLSKALAAGAPPPTPNSKGECLRRVPVWHAEGEGRQFPSSPRAPETLGMPLSLRLNIFNILLYRLDYTE